MSRILVISDDQAFAYSLRVLLMRDGHSVMVAEDASAGLFRLFMDAPGFVVVNLTLDREVRKVCRHLRGNTGTPALIIGRPGLRADIEPGVWPESGRFLPLPASVRRIWRETTDILAGCSTPPGGGSAVGAGSGGGPREPGNKGRGYPGGPGRPADRQCRAYERHRRVGRGGDRGPTLQIWV